MSSCMLCSTNFTLNKRSSKCSACSANFCLQCVIPNGWCRPCHQVRSCNNDANLLMKVDYALLLCFVACTMPSVNNALEKQDLVQLIANNPRYQDQQQEQFPPNELVGQVNQIQDDFDDVLSSSNMHVPIARPQQINNISSSYQSVSSGLASSNLPMTNDSSNIQRQFMLSQRQLSQARTQTPFMAQYPSSFQYGLTMQGIPDMIDAQQQQQAAANPASNRVDRLLASNISLNPAANIMGEAANNFQTPSYTISTSNTLNSFRTMQYQGISGVPTSQQLTNPQLVLRMDPSMGSFQSPSVFSSSSSRRQRELMLDSSSMGVGVGGSSANRNQYYPNRFSPYEAMMATNEDMMATRRLRRVASSRPRQAPFIQTTLVHGLGHLHGHPAYATQQPSAPPVYCPKLSDLKEEDKIKELSEASLKAVLESNYLNPEAFVGKEKMVAKVTELRDLYLKSEKRAKEIAEKDEIESKNSRKKANEPPTIDLTENEDDLCKICMEKPMDCVLLECGHMCSCVDCTKSFKECPICRLVVSRAVRVFKA